MIHFKLLTFCLVIFSFSSASARPVSFVGGTTILSESRVFENEATVAYTFLPQLSLGVHVLALRGFEKTPTEELYFAGAMANWLVVRGLGDDWQSNVYLSLGGGGLRFQTAQLNQAAMLGTLETDFETRQFYISAKAEGIATQNSEINSYARARVGFAPFLSEMNGLHAWVLLQVEKHSWVQFTDTLPMLRFFYQNLLFELGTSFQGRTQFNFTTEF